MKNPFKLCSILSVAVMSFSAILQARDLPIVVLGGDREFDTLADPKNSEKFRAAGGGIFIHNQGWQVTTPEQKDKISELFSKKTMIILIGFDVEAQAVAWGRVVERDYIEAGIQPSIITAGSAETTAADWAAFTEGLRTGGAPNSSQVLPFLNVNDEASQAVAQDAGGGNIFLQATTFVNSETVRASTADTIKRLRKNKLKSVIFLAPQDRDTQFEDNAKQVIETLAGQDALPDVICCTNWQAPDYSRGTVFNENEPGSVGAVALMIIKDVLPKVKIPFGSIFEK